MFEIPNPNILVALLRTIEAAALAMVASNPAEAVRLVYLAALLREVRK